MQVSTVVHLLDTELPSTDHFPANFSLIEHSSSAGMLFPKPSLPSEPLSYVPLTSPGVGCPSSHSSGAPKVDDRALAYLHRDVVPRGQALADGRQGGLLDVPDAPVDAIDGVVAFPLPRGFVPTTDRIQQTRVCKA